MNKAVLLYLILGEIERDGRDWPKEEQEIDLEETLIDLNNRRPVTLPATLPQEPEEMVRTLRQHFSDEVSLISLVLSQHFPETFIFYRVSSLEGEIFEGLEFFADIMPEFDLPFSAVGRKGMERYLRLNEALLSFARKVWPDLDEHQEHIAAFLDVLAVLFLEWSEYQRYWLVTAKPVNFRDLDDHEKTTWSGRKEMQDGDLVFIYRTAPRSAITDVFRIDGVIDYDPYGSWEGIWVPIVRVGAIEDVAFADMRADEILGQWAPVRRSFQGVVAEAIPHSIYNRLIGRLSPNTRETLGLRVEPIPSSPTSGQFALEQDFEELAIVPLLQQWMFSYKAQHPCHFYVGSQPYRGRVDFYVSDERGALTLFENKLRILNEQELKSAVDQAKSYALLLGLPSFVVAAPEGFWVYSLKRNEEKLEMQVSAEELGKRHEELRNLILQLRE